MSTFVDLGLRPELAGAVAGSFDAPSPLQIAAIPVLRRGGNAVLVASSGAGVTAAWGLPLLDRLAGQGDATTTAERDASDPVMRPRAVVLTTTEERAVRGARALAWLGARTGVAVRALTASWSARRSDGVVVAPVEAATRAIRDSLLKLDSAIAIVFEGLSELTDLAGAPAIEQLVSTMPADAQRVVLAAAWTREVERFTEAHARRALTIPPQRGEVTAGPPDAAGTLAFLTTTETDKAAALARVLRRDRPEPASVATRSAQRAAALVAELRLRGFSAGADVADAGDAVIRPHGGGEGRTLIAYDVPFDAATIARMNPTDGLVLVEPRELAHLREIAAQAGFTLKSIGGRPMRGAVPEYRRQVAEAMAEQDLDAQYALLEPLFDEHSAFEVAAALSALLRERAPAEPVAAESESRPDRPVTFTRLFVSAGSRDNVRPGDLVGAITGEASVSGDQVGRIEMRDTFSVVEVAADVADRVIRALNGTTMRGRSLRVDYDRRGAAAPSRPPRRVPRPRKASGQGPAG